MKVKILNAENSKRIGQVYDLGETTKCTWLGEDVHTFKKADIGGQSYYGSVYTEDAKTYVILRKAGAKHHKPIVMQISIL